MSPTESIDLLIADGIVDALIQQVKTGKEAEVFIVQKGDNFFAAKVYKERTARNFKNNVAYREGRAVKNTRDARAIAKGSKYGLSLAESDWRAMEHDALVTVTAAGVRVPKPELIYEGILLMELVLGQDGQPAPRLIDVPLTREEALAHHRDIIGQIVGILTCDLIHGDLSPYNILMAWNGPTIIDLPQVIKAAHNNQAEQFLVRDVRNVTEHFARYAPELKKRIHDGYAIWRRYMKRDLPRDYFPEEGEGQPPKQQHQQHHSAPSHAPRPQQQHQGALAHAPRPQQQQHQGAPAHAPRPQHRPEGGRPAGAAPNQHHARPAPHRPAQPAAAHAPANGTDASHRAPQPAAPHAPANGAAAPALAARAPASNPRPEGQRPPRRNDRPQGQNPRRPEAPRRPTPPGPVIERVNRLAPVSSNSGNAPAPESRPSRFSQHHRQRPGGA